MATTQAQLDALIAMRNSGVLRTSNGQYSAEFRSMAELERAIAAAQQDLAAAAGETMVRRVHIIADKGL